MSKKRKSEKIQSRISDVKPPTLTVPVASVSGANPPNIKQGSSSPTSQQKAPPPGGEPKWADPGLEKYVSGVDVGKNETNQLIPPFSWVFSSPRVAFWASMTIIFGFWLGLCLARKFFWVGEANYWSQEVCLEIAFLYAATFSLVLSKHFHALQKHLLGKHPQLDVILLEQNRRFHHAGWLVLMPFLLSALAISLRFLTLDYLIPFRFSGFEILFLTWLYLGFCFLLNAAVLCGRYSEIIRQLGESIIKGHLNRKDVNLISSFYFRIALHSSVFFALSALTVFSLHIIYTYSGNIWPGYSVIRKLPSMIWGNHQNELAESLALIYEVLLIGILYIFASGAALAYFVAPQWSVHWLLSERKKSLLAKIDEDREKAENAMFANPREATFEEFCRHSRYSERINQLPEWPFASEGFSSTFLLVCLPGLLLLLKEVFLEALVNVITK